jgi:hypothetical protein
VNSVPKITAIIQYKHFDFAPALPDEEALTEGEAGKNYGRGAQAR